MVKLFLQLGEGCYTSMCEIQKLFVSYIISISSALTADVYAYEYCF